MIEAEAIEALSAEFAKPAEFEMPAGTNLRRYALPPGWTIDQRDDDGRLLEFPRRKIAKVALRDTKSFVDYAKTHGAPDRSTVWCSADFKAGRVSFLAVLNDHGAEPERPNWRDHIAQFSPAFSEEWNRWHGMDRKPFSQADFATFIEDNLRDIATAEGFPTGAAMLQMALQFEATQEMRIKSHIRLQNGGIQLSYVGDDDAQTIQQMQMFDRFAIGIPVFWGGQAYRLEARLRYRAKDAKVSFWFELIRPDLTLEDASRTVIEAIQAGTALPMFHGQPFQS